MAQTFDFSNAAKAVTHTHAQIDAAEKISGKVQQVEDALQNRAKTLLTQLTEDVACMLQQAKETVPYTSLRTDFSHVDVRTYWLADMQRSRDESLGSMREYLYTAPCRNFVFTLDRIRTQFEVCAFLTLPGCSIDERNPSERAAFRKQYKQFGADNWPTKLTYAVYMLQGGYYLVFPDAAEETLSVQCFDVANVASLLQQFILCSAKNKLRKTDAKLYGYVS